MAVPLLGRAKKLLTRPPGTTDGWFPEASTLEGWRRGQIASKATEKSMMGMAKLRADESGLHMYEESDDMNKLYVPIKKHEHVTRMHHKSSLHLGLGLTRHTPR